MTKNKLQTVGRRKCASARVRMVEGKGEVVINGKPMAEFFPYFQWQEIILAPLKAVKMEKKFDISAKVQGGGKRGLADALSLAIARALVETDKELKKTLKSLKFMTRDARVKERKKPGLKRARRAPQWSKR